MSPDDIAIEIAESLADADRAALFGWGNDVWNDAGRAAALKRRPAQWHVVVRRAGVPVAHAGVVRQVGTVGGEPVAFGGVGGVITPPAWRGRGFAAAAMAAAAGVCREQAGAAFGLLFCFEEVAPFYARLGWQRVEAPVVVDQPAGKVAPPFVTMALPLRGRAWPAGAVDVGGFPW